MAKSKFTVPGRSQPGGLLETLPKVYCSGMMNASVLNQRSKDLSSLESFGLRPLAFGRSTAVPPVLAGSPVGVTVKGAPELKVVIAPMSQPPSTAFTTE